MSSLCLISWVKVARLESVWSPHCDRPVMNKTLDTPERPLYELVVQLF